MSRNTSSIVGGLAVVSLAVLAVLVSRLYGLSHQHEAVTDLGAAASGIAIPSTSAGSDANANQSVSADTDNLNRQISLLQQSVSQQQQTILALTRDIASLKDELTKIADEQSQFDPNADSAGSPISAVDGTPAGSALGAVSNRGGNIFEQSRESALPPREALVRSGVDAVIADEITQRLDARALADLQIRDQAAREGWLESEDFRERRDALLPEPVSVREELGIDTWDRYLYNVGRTNRVVVSSIMAGSAAQLAGFMAGDIIYAYAGSRVFTMQELQQATRAGEAGAPTEVQVLRSGGTIILDVPRGPLGVSMTATRVDPDSALPADN